MSNSGALNAGQPIEYVPNKQVWWLKVVRQAAIAAVSGSLAVAGIAVMLPAAHHPAQVHKADSPGPGIYFHADGDPNLTVHSR
jgi:hypothetical protein